MIIITIIWTTDHISSIVCPPPFFSSVSDDEPLEPDGLGVLIAYHAIVAALNDRAPLHLQQPSEVFKQFNLQRIVLAVVFDVSLMILQVFHDVLLLAQLGIEELRVGLELVAQALVGRVQELGLIADALEERVVYFILNVV